MSVRKSERLQEVRGYLLDLIENDDGRSGTRLPTERDLGTRFGLSRNSVRKVLDSLENEGKIKRHVGRGTFVCKLPSVDLEPSKFLETDFDVASAIEFRLLLEPEFAELAVTKSTRTDIRRIDDILTESENASTSELYVEKSFAFHLAIAAATKNPLLINIFGGLRSTMCRLTPERHKGHQDAHQAISRAIRNGEADRSRALMTAHLLELRQELIRY